MSNSCDNAHNKAAAIAKYDDEKKAAYIEYANGEKKYAK